MIDPKELREGNLGYSKLWKKVMTWGPEEGGHPHYGFKCPDDGIILCGSTDDIDPIPITPEWLERLGFYRHRDSFSLSFGIYDAEFDTKNGYFYLSCNEYEDIVEHIKHVHQLQNLYFALTGEELKVKPIDSNVLPQIGTEQGG